MAETTRAQLDALAAQLTDEGKLIEAGWIGLRAAAIDKNASDTELEQRRIMFFAGAQHLYASIMGILEEGEEPTDNDLDRLAGISTELDKFLEDYAERNGINRQGVSA